MWKHLMGKYPNAGMTEENTVEVVRQRFPVEVPPPCRPLALWSRGDRGPARRGRVATQPGAW